MAPCIVTRDGKAILGIGTPGSYGIPQTTLQMLLNALELGMTVQAAIEAPRARTFERTLIHAEARIPAEALEGLRTRGTDAEQRGLTAAGDDAVLDAMAADPILIERPLVETEKGVRLCRPAEKVDEIL